MMAVVYFEVEGAPGQYFRCEPYRSTMSVVSCAGMYRAEKGRQNGRHPNCHGCSLGAEHAGEKPVTVGLFGSKLCPRCTRPAARIVKGLCVSCVNRGYEIERGVNAKGSKPSRLKPLMPVALAFSADGDAKVVIYPRVTGRLEAMLRVLRTQPGDVEFGWSTPMPDLPQRDLFAPRAVLSAG